MRSGHRSSGRVLEAGIEIVLVGLGLRAGPCIWPVIDTTPAYRLSGGLDKYVPSSLSP